MKHRIIQYILIAIILSAITAGYFYFSSDAAQKINSSKVNNLTSGLIGYFTFDGADTTSAVATNMAPGGGNNGTIVNALPAVGKIGQALNFDGNGDYVTAANTNTTGLDTITMTAWIKRSGASSTGYESVIETHNSDFDEHFLDTNCGDNNIHFGYVIDYNPTAVTFSNSIIADGAWHYLTGVYDRNAGKLYIYVDGVLKNSTNASGDVVGGGRMIVGAGGSGGYTGCAGSQDRSGWFNGIIDEPRIYNRALSQSEITELYQQGQTKINASQTNKLTSGLYGYYTMDGQDINWGTNIITDKGSGGNNGTLANMSSSATPIIGKISQGLKLDDVNDYVDLGTSFMDWESTQPWSISFWAYGDSSLCVGTCNQGYIFSKALDHQTLW